MTVEVVEVGAEGAIEVILVNNTSAVQIVEPVAQESIDISQVNEVKSIDVETGQKGDTGPVGPIGPQGIQGLKGDQGIAGPIGPQGEKGLTGDKGADGVTPVLIGTSTSSVGVGAGALKTFQTQEGLAFTSGMFIRISSTVTPSTYMAGSITSYTGTTLTLTPSEFSGTGTLNSWKITPSGVRGATGATGSTGATGATGAAGTNADTTKMEGLVPHDGTAGGGTRLTGYYRVRWVGGTTRPTNMIVGDIWEQQV